MATTSKKRKMVMIGRKIPKAEHDEELQNLNFWLSRPVEERIAAVQQLRAQFMEPGHRMDKTIGTIRRLR